MIIRSFKHTLLFASYFKKQFSCQLNKKPDLYTLLQLTPKATPEQIRFNYFKLLSNHHHHQNQFNKVRSSQKLLHQAYAILSNQKLKAKYDKENGFTQQNDDSSKNLNLNLSKDEQMSKKYSQAKRGFSAIIGDQKTRLQQRLIAAVLLSIFLMTLLLVFNANSYKGSSKPITHNSNTVAK